MCISPKAGIRKGEHARQLLTLSLFLSRSVVFECRLFTYAFRDVGDGVDGGGPNGGDAGRRDCCSASGYSRAVRAGDCHFVRPLPGWQRRKASRVRALWLFLVSCVSFGNLGHGLVTRGLTKNSKGQKEIDRAFVRVTTLRRSSLIDNRRIKPFALRAQCGQGCPRSSTLAITVGLLPRFSRAGCPGFQRSWRPLDRSHR